MNIAYILHSTTPTDGATKSFLIMLSGLMAKGVKPIVILPDKNGVYAKLREMGIPVYTKPYRMRTYPRTNTFRAKLMFVPRLLARLISNIVAIRYTTKLLRSHNIQLVHSNVGMVDIGFCAARKLGLPHIYHIREYGTEDFGLRYFPTWKSFYRQLDAPKSYAIYITRHLLQHHHQEGKVSSRVIYNGISPSAQQFPQIVKNCDYFLFAGRIEPAKKVDVLLKAYMLYANNEGNPLKLYIAGHVSNPAYMERLRCFVQQNGLQAHVSFLGKRTDINDLMRDARAVVVLSEYEGFGRCLAEAMSVGTLTIGYNTTGTKEQFDNGLKFTGEEIGLRFNSVKELSELLSEVTRTPIEHYRPYKERALLTVTQLYTKENNITQVYKFYTDILQHNIS